MELLCLLIVVLASSAALADEPGCSFPGGIGTTTECFEQIRNDRDVQLNETYQRILKALKEQGRAEPRMLEVRRQIVEAQRSWLAFRDKDCAAIVSIGRPPEDATSDRTLCLMERTSQRLVELQEIDARLGAGASVEVYGRDELVKGQHLGYWLMRYWHWVRSFPENRNPSSDETGSLCGVRQNQPVFFLTGSAKSDPVLRTCTVPARTPVLIPVLNVTAEAVDKPVECEAYLKPLREFNESIRDARLVVNGESIDLSTAVAETGCFELVDQRSGRTGKAAGAGLWVILKPLRPGIYRVQFSGRYEKDGFSQNVAYHLQVE